MPTRRKPRVQRKIEGEEAFGSELGVVVGVEEGIEAVMVEVIDMREAMVGRLERNVR